MKFRTMLVARALLVADVATAADALPANSADAAYAALVACMQELLSPPVEIRGDPAALHAWVAPRQVTFLLLRYDFARKFADDPRHWTSLLDVAWTGANNPKSLQTHAQAHPEDAAKIAELIAWAGPALAALERDPAAPATIAANLRSRRCTIEIGEQEAAGFRGEKPDFAQAAAMLDDIAAKAPEFSRTFLEQRLAKLMLKFDEPAAAARLQRLIGDPKSTEALRKMAEGELSAHDALRKTIEMSFTAVDGREVDLAKLRGKVVLVDFWATWCGPCVAELPNVKKVFADYHAKGFEVIGVALENGDLVSKDTPEQAAEKLAKAKRKLTEFTARNEMPWPQYCDAKHWKTELSAKYAINSIPAMFLLDQEGKVVSTNARGEKLETEVRRLLQR